MLAKAKDQPVLFITYCDHDEFQIREIASELRKQIPVFAYPFDIPGGASITEGIRGGSEKVLLAVALSESSINTQWIQTQIKEEILEPFKDSLTVLLLKLEQIPVQCLSTLSYASKYETIDLSGENYATAMSRLIARIGPSFAIVRPALKPVPYEISGIFQPARPATSLFADLKRQIEQGNIDQKFLYWDVRAALRWQRIAELSTYMTSQISTNLLVVNAGSIIDVICSDAKCTAASFVNLGVGTGTKDYHTLSGLLSHIQKVVYIAFDESFPIIQLTMKNLEELLSANADSLSAHYIVDDFANLDKHEMYIESVEPEGAPRIIGFLGGSLGNFDESRLLSIIRCIMRQKDYLILGVEYIARRDDETLIRNYSDRRMKEFLFGPIRDVTGREPDWDRDFEYAVYPTTAFPRYSVVNNSKVIIGRVRHNDNKIELFSSTKYEKDSLEHFLRDKAHFQILSTFTTLESPPQYGKYILKLAER